VKYRLEKQTAIEKGYDTAQGGSGTCKEGRMLADDVVDAKNGS
jgi:hypothetical protein